MAISIGVGHQGRNKRVLRCTFSGADLIALTEKWGERPRLVFAAEPIDGGRWLLQLQPREHGNIGVPKRLGDREYLTFVWSLAPAELLGMAAASKVKSNIGGHVWDPGALSVTVDGTTARKPVTRDVAPKPKVTKEKTVMKKNAIYELEKSTPGSVRYGWVSGDKGMGTIYIRKEEISGEPPKRISVAIAAVD